jgi:hypothetical protein
MIPSSGETRGEDLHEHGRSETDLDSLAGEKNSSRPQFIEEE